MNIEDRKAIRQAFLEGRLQVRAADPNTGDVAFHVVSDVMRHDSPHKELVHITLEDGVQVTSTKDHSFFVHEKGHLLPVEGGAVKVGDRLVKVVQDVCSDVAVVAVREAPKRQYMYDLCVPGPENFTLTSGLLAHNSYSIGGISLDVNKASSYESLKGNAEGQLDKMLEAKTRTVKYIRGLQQSRYGVGVRSSFGSHTGGSILTPRKYLGF